jgi:hypothetical protein
MVRLLIFLAALCCLIQPSVGSAKFGEAPPVKGKVKCCFEKGGGFLSGRCLEMSEQDCRLKRGEPVRACGDCTGEKKDQQKKKSYR